MRKFMLSMLSDGAAVSFGRAGAFFIVTTWLIICTYLAFKSGATVDIPLQWAGLAALLFGTTKFAPSQLPTPTNPNDGGVQ